MKDHRSVVLVLLLCLVAGTESTSEKPGPVCNDPDQKLMNKVVYEFNSSSFSNQLDPSGIKWEFIPSREYKITSNSTTSYTIADNDTVQPRFDRRFTVNSTYLKIHSVAFTHIAENETSTAGLYILTYKTGGCQSMANLIAIYLQPWCQCFNETDSDNAVLKCKVIYGESDKYPNQVNLTWTSDSGKAYSGSQTISKSSGNLYEAISEHSITSSDAENFTCGVNFDAPKPGAPANMATNAASFKPCTVKNCVKKNITIEEKSPKGNDSKSEQPGPVCSDRNQILMNKVVKEGASFSFSNRLDPKGVKWEIAPSYKGNSTSTSFTIAANNSVEPPCVGDYAVNSTHLNIPVVTFVRESEPEKASTTGLYTLTYKTDGCQSMANLIVADQPRCSCSKPGSNSDNAVLTCEFQYTESDKYPNEASLIWTSDSGNAYIGRQKISILHYNVHDAVSNHLITSSDAAKFTCVVTFTAPQPSGPANMAASAPEYIASCTIANCVKKKTAIEKTNEKVCFEGPVCNCSKIDSDNAVLACKFQYGGTQNYPNQTKMIWTTGCGQAYSGRQNTIIESNNLTYTSTSSHPVKSSDAAKFVCRVNFNASGPDAPSNMTSNAFAFNASCTIENCVKKDIA